MRLEPRIAEAGDGGDLTMDEIERRAILGALEKTGGNRTQAAQLLGIGLRTLQRKLKEYRVAGKGIARLCGAVFLRATRQIGASRPEGVGHSGKFPGHDLCVIMN